MKQKFTAFLSILLAALALFSLSSCGSAADIKREFFLMDTYMTLSLSGQDADLIADEIRDKAEALDQLLSVTDEESDIYRLNHAEGKAVTVDQSTLSLISRSEEICETLDGSLDISLYPVSAAWGFTTDEYRIPKQEELSALLTHVDYHDIQIDTALHTVRLKEKMMLDLGAAAKGYLADAASDILSENERVSGILNFGGTILPWGMKSGKDLWKVGIADPDNPSVYFGTLSLTDTVVSTSGGYERFFIGEDGKRYIHIIDPKTGCPVDNSVLSVTVICKSGVLADALSTALFVMGADEAERFYHEHNDLGFDYVMLTEDGIITLTKGIRNCFSLSQGYDFAVSVIEA